MSQFLNPRFFAFALSPRRVLQESMFGYHSQLAGSSDPTNTPAENNTNLFTLPIGADDLESRPTTLDADLAKALLMSEQEQRERHLETEREQQMLEEVLRLSLQDK